MKSNKTGVLVVNLGTPDHYSVPHVRKYLREFLMDGRVIDIPHFNRWLLVNLIIAPFRAPKSAKVYQELWTEKGSPLMFYGEEIEKKLQHVLGDSFIVKLGMRYQNPSIKFALEHLQNSNISSLIVLPLFPQYASATTGSIHEKVMEQIKKWENIPELHFVNGYSDDEDFIKAFAERAREKLKDKEYDLMLFSYHGLPERQILKASVDDFCQLNDCCSNYDEHNQFCYRAQCYETTRLLASELGIPKEKYQVVFQSRLGKSPWIRPYADEVIKSLPSKGYKKVAVMMPSFVADCLETTVEVGSEFKEIFEEAGGEEWIFIESLNDSESWITTLNKLILQNL
jgi:ferrochelatase